jgi:hypothetical protein
VDVALPDGVQLAGIDAPGWSCRERKGGVICKVDDALAPGATSTLRLKLRAPATPTTLSTKATVSAHQFDPDEGQPASDNTVTEITKMCTPSASGCT